MRSMGAPGEISELVERFERNIDAYKKGAYNETQVRREFVDPFFEALGWDVSNKAGSAEAYKDVVHEDAIRVGNSVKAPDYCFRVGGTRKFFVEAKKPSVNVRTDAHPAYQLRRYAWSAKLPISILTDFEELAVYDCSSRPDQGDSASKQRTLYLTYDQYEDRWGEIESVFSKRAVYEGAFDKYEISLKGKRGTETVDEAFLKEMDSWRLLLARNIALRNPNLSLQDLNESVQRIIDRVVFLRICEDRGIEDYGRLQSIAPKKDSYAELCTLFEKADAKYNSGLFYFTHENGRASPVDLVTRDLKIDDSVVKGILSKIYYPESPYEFSVLPADILGKVYEEFLGKTIRLTKGRQAKIEEKPEVRKAGGVYYTPAYVVEHLVKNTLGKLLEGSTPTKVAKIRVLDPACGSGSFLIVAYQRLLDWHLEWYVNDGAEKHAKGKSVALFQGRRGKWHLTVTKRKEILLNNIYGVDLDPQAVEVSKLSLLLKVLEGEVEWLKNLKLFEERALPDLGKNLQCGNSLVGFDFIGSLPTSALTGESEVLETVRTFDWKKSFPAVFEDGGFDVVVGNPPYLSYAGRQKVELPGVVKSYFEQIYRCSGWPTSHSFFIEKAVTDLSRRFVAFIVPDQVGHLDGYSSLRSVVGTQSKIAEVKYWGEKVFKGVTTPALTFVTDRNAQGNTRIIELSGAEYDGELRPGASWFLSPKRDLVERLSEGCFSVQPFVKDCGIRTTAAKEQVFPLSEFKAGDLVVLEGKRIGRYWCSSPTKVVRPKGDVHRSTEANYDAARFLIRQTAAYPIVAPHKYTKYFRNSVHALLEPGGEMDIRYLVGLLNSKVVRFCYVALTREAGQKAFPQVKLGALAKLPLKNVDLTQRKDQKVHDDVVEHVQALLDLQESLEAAVGRSSDSMRQRITALDERLDRLVFSLYGLSEEEISLVEQTLSEVPDTPDFPDAADYALKGGVIKAIPPKQLVARNA